jgi:hypothetical protein
VPSRQRIDNDSRCSNKVVWPGRLLVSHETALSVSGLALVYSAQLMNTWTTAFSER